MSARIDLVIPVYGDAPFLDDTIKSCANSRDISFNLFWVLDRPSENVRNKIEEFSARHGNSKVIVSKLPGIVPALNIGIDSGNAQYIARLDSDDLMESNRLRIQCEFLDSNRVVGVVGSQMKLISKENKVLGLTKYPRDHTSIVKLLEFQNCLGHPSVMFRRNVFEKVGGYRSQFTGAEDYDLWFRVARFADLHNLDDLLTSYRISNFQFTRREESNQGIVETAVRFASLGYDPKSATVMYPQRNDLRVNNKLIFDYLKKFDHPTYRAQKAIDLISKAYSVKAKRKRYSIGIYFLVLALFSSPKKVFQYFSIKIYGLNWRN